MSRSGGVVEHLHVGEGQVGMTGNGGGGRFRLRLRLVSADVARDRFANLFISAWQCDAGSRLEDVLENPRVADFPTRRVR